MAALCESGHGHLYLKVALSFAALIKLATSSLAGFLRGVRTSGPGEPLRLGIRPVQWSYVTNHEALHRCCWPMAFLPADSQRFKLIGAIRPQSVDCLSDEQTIGRP